MWWRSKCFWETYQYQRLTVKRCSAILGSLIQNWWFCLGCRPDVESTHFATWAMILSTAAGRGDAGAGPSSSMDGNGSEPTTAGGGRSACGCCSWSCFCCCGGTAGRRVRGNEDIYVVHIEDGSGSRLNHRPQLAPVPRAGVAARHGQTGVAHAPHGLGDKCYEWVRGGQG